MTDKYQELRDWLNGKDLVGSRTSSPPSNRQTPANNTDTIRALLADADRADAADQQVVEYARISAQTRTEADARIAALERERDALRAALRWTAGTLQSACCLAGPISENSAFALGDETRSVAQICDAADAALALSQGDQI